MTPAERKVSTDRILFECMAVMSTKEVDYASKEDVMANFKRIADRSGLTKYQVWLIYFSKHVDAITNAIKYHPQMPMTETVSEPLYGRIADAINYLTILANLQDEDMAQVDRACDEFLEPDERRPHPKLPRADHPLGWPYNDPSVRFDDV